MFIFYYSKAKIDDMSFAMHVIDKSTLKMSLLANTEALSMITILWYVYSLLYVSPSLTI